MNLIMQSMLLKHKHFENQIHILASNFPQQYKHINNKKKYYVLKCVIDNNDDEKCANIHDWRNISKIIIYIPFNSTNWIISN